MFWSVPFAVSMFTVICCFGSPDVFTECFGVVVHLSRVLLAPFLIVLFDLPELG